MVAALTPDNSARFIGGLFGLFLVFLGLVKCVRIMRRPTTDTCCVTGLLLFLCGWLGSSIITAGQQVFGWPQIAMMIWWPFLVLINLAALIVGIVGLVRYDRARMVLGRAQAGWAITLSGLSIVVGLVAAVVAIVQKSGGGSLMTKDAGRMVFAEDRCAITSPSGWKNIDPKALGPSDAKRAYRKFSPELYFILIAENLGEDMDANGYAAIVKGNIVSGLEVKEQSEETVKLGDLEFRRIQTQAELGRLKTDLQYEHWITTRNGMFWQLVVWGNVSDAASVARAGREFARGFEVLPESAAQSVPGSLKDVRRPAAGYSTVLTGTGWDEPGAAFRKLPLIDFGGKRGGEAFAVVPIGFPDAEAPDLDACAEGLLSVLEFAWPLGGDTIQQPWKSAYGDGLEFVTEREVGQQRFVYLLRIARAEKAALMTAAWGLKSPDRLDRLRKALDGIKVSAPTGAVPEPRAEQRKPLGLVFNNIGLSLFRRERFADAAPWFERAFALKAEDSTLLDNWANALQSNNRPAEALAVLDPHQARFPQAFALQSRRAALMVLTGKVDEGHRHFLSLIDAGISDESELLAWVKELAAANRHDLAEEAATKWNEKRPSKKARLWRAEIVANGGDLPRAIREMEALTAENPDDAHLANTLGEFLNRADDYTRAGEVAEKVLATSAENVRALEVLGWSQMGRKWYRDAKGTFERALKVRPGNEDLNEALRQASAALGQGNNSDVKVPLTPVPVPKTVETRVNDWPSRADFGKGESAVLLQRLEGYHFVRGEPLRKTTRRRFKVLDQEGVNAYSSLEFVFHPLSERIFVNRLEVRDEKGELAAKGSLDDSFVRDADNDLSTHRKLLQVQVPALKPGYVIEVDVTLEDRSPAKEFAFDRHVFGHQLPCAVDAVYVSGDVQHVRTAFGKSDGVATIKGDGLIAFVAGDLEVPPYEPFSTELETRIPTVYLSGASQDWVATARTYLAEIADRLKPEDDVNKVAAEICRGVEGDRKKVALLARHVQKDITYKGIEFGVRARRPNLAGETLRQRFGDCKDHALLLHQLLRAAGVHSHLALVQTSFMVQPELPSLDQFDHMVLHVPSLGANWFVDATDKYLPLELYPASGLWHSHALVLDPAKPRLVPPVTSLPEGCADVTSRRTVAPKGRDWLVEETLSASGYYASSLRGSFAGLSPTEQTRKAQAILADTGAAEVTDCVFENIEALHEPARLRLTYAIRDAIRTEGTKSVGPLPALWERYYLNLHFLPQRKTPFRYRFPFRFKSEVAAKLPPSASFPRFDKQGKSPFSHWEFSGMSKANPQNLHFDFRIRSGEGKAADYAAFCEAWTGARRAWEANAQW